MKKFSILVAALALVVMAQGVQADTSTTTATSTATSTPQVTATSTGAATATSTVSTTTAPTVEVLKALLAEIERLRNQVVQTLIAGIQSGKITSEEIKVLQKTLSSYSDLYPEKLVTGKLGPLTQRAIQKFQKKYMASSTPLYFETRVAPGQLIAPGLAKKGATSTLPASSTQALPSGISKKLNFWSRWFKTKDVKSSTTTSTTTSATTSSSN